MFWFFGCQACGVLAPQLGIEHASPMLEGKVLSTGPPAKSQQHFKLAKLSYPQDRKCSYKLISKKKTKTKETQLTAQFKREQKV